MRRHVSRELASRHDAGATPTESVLVERVRSGDAAAFEEIFGAYSRHLCDFARSYVRDSGMAEEIVQNLFLRLWMIRSSWNPSGSIRSYLFSACRNGALNHLQHEHIVARAAERSVREDLTPALGEPAAAADEQVQASELAAALHRAVHELTEQRRMVVILRWEHQLSYAEIARVLGISVRGVETHFARAIATLRERLSSFQQ